MSIHRGKTSEKTSVITNLYGGVDTLGPIYTPPDNPISGNIRAMPKLHNMSDFLATRRLTHYPVPINYNDNQSRLYNINMRPTDCPDRSMMAQYEYLDAPECVGKSITSDYNKCPLRIIRGDSNDDIEKVKFNSYNCSRKYIRYGKWMSSDSNVYLNSPIWRRGLSEESRNIEQKEYGIMQDNIIKIIKGAEQDDAILSMVTN
jgi:hypothetical protein